MVSDVFTRYDLTTQSRGFVSRAGIKFWHICKTKYTVVFHHHKVRPTRNLTGHPEIILRPQTKVRI